MSSGPSFDGDEQPGSEPEDPEAVPFGGGTPAGGGWQAAMTSLAEFLRVSAGAGMPSHATERAGDRDHTQDSDPSPGAAHECLEWCPICRAADAVRAANQPDTREQLSELQQEAMLTARAVLDHYLERAGSGAQPGGPEPDLGVEDIPID